MVLLLGRRSWSTKRLANELDVDERTIRRDLKWARKIGLPIEDEKNGAERRYRLPASAARDFAITKAEREALALVRKAASAFEGTDALRVLRALAGEANEGPGHLSIATPRKPDLRVIQPLEHAVHVRRYARILYRKARARGPAWREVAPAHVYAAKNGASYLIAWDPDDEQYKRFKLVRIVLVEASERRAQGLPPPPLPDDATGVIYHDDPIDLVLRFDPSVAGIAEEYGPTKSARVELQPDGSAILRAKHRGLPEARAFVLSWGAAVEVLEPESLRKAVHDELRKAARKYVPREAKARERTDSRSDESARLGSVTRAEGEGR